MKTTKLRLACSLFLPVLLLGFGCAATKETQKPAAMEKEPVVRKPAQPERPLAEGTAEVREKTTPPEILRPPAFKRAVPEKTLPPSKPIDPKSLALARGPVTINVEKMPLPDFIIYALGETLKVSFVMDQKVMESKEPITLRMTEAMAPDKALEIVLGLFEKYNLYVEEKAGALYVLHKSPAPKGPFDIKVGQEITESPASVLQVVPLRYIRPADIEPLIKELYKTGVQIRPYPRENVLLLYGQASQTKQIMEFIGTFDVPYLQEKKVALLRLTYWQIDDFIKQISQILEGVGVSIAKSPREPGTLLIPVKPLGSVLVVSPDDTSFNYILDWKDRLDKPEAAGAEERPFTYIPKYSRASDLVDSIKNLYGIMPAPSTPATTPPPSAPGAPGAVGRPARPGAAAAGRPASPGASAALKISSDDRRNMIIVVCPAAEYEKILKLLDELDIPPRQVLIEATVVELTLRDELKFGFEWFIKNRMFGEGAYSLGTLFSLSTGGPGLIYQFISDSDKFSALVNAYALNEKVNILSTPRLTVLDNQEASITVGTETPVITSEVSAADISTAEASVLRNIQYRSTGVILRVKPTIHTQGLLTLNITQEVSEVGSNPPGIDSPTILMRQINSTVVAAQGESVVLGGLISESKTATVNKVPLLGDIPLLGVLFRTTGKDVSKTELLVFIKPTILSSIDDAAAVTNQLKKELKWFNK